MWLNHHGLFERIARLDRALMFINLLLLMAIVFIPFSTAELGANIQVPSDANTAAGLYAINASVIALFFGALWIYALTHPHLLAPNVDRQAALRAWPRFSAGSVVYLSCIPISQFSPIAVVIVCAALAVYYSFERLPDITRQSAAGARRQP
jgi:uncharacterized membrane protein